jgi:hypothetical protein
MSINPSVKNVDGLRFNRVLKEISVRDNITQLPSPRDEDQSSWKKVNVSKEAQELFDGPRNRPLVSEFRELVTRILSSSDDCTFKALPTKKMLSQKPSEHWADIKDQALPALYYWRSS